MLSSSPSLGFILLSPSPLSACCISVSTVLNSVSSHLTFMFVHSCHPWPSSHLSVQWLLLTWTHPLRFQTVWLLASSCPCFSCHSLPPTCFPLPPHSLSPPSMVTSSPAMFLLSCSPFHPPLFLPPPSPQWHLKQGHWQSSNVHLHLCSNCRWAISKVMTCPWKSSKEHQGKRHVDWQPPFAQNSGCL